MSFSQEQKTDIIEQGIKTSCCRRSMMQGILAARAISCEKRIEISVDSDRTAEFISLLIQEIYSKEAEVRKPPRGGRCRQVVLESPSASKYLASIDDGGLLFAEKCPMCQSAFLRGIFLASGRVSDPGKQYLLEFSVGKRTDRMCELFSDIGLVPRVSNKPNERVIYFKRSGFIEDFFALAGMNNTAFAFMNEKINGEIRNNVNRITNCTTNNIDRAISASMRQIALIEELVGRGLLSQLPEELEQTARLRLEHKDMSLAQLSALTSPRISKPGLSHRLRKITSIAEALLKK